MPATTPHGHSPFQEHHATVDHTFTPCAPPEPPDSAPLPTAHKPCVSYANDHATQQLIHAMPKLVHQCLPMPKDPQHYCQPFLSNI